MGNSNSSFENGSPNATATGPLMSRVLVAAKKKIFVASDDGSVSGTGRREKKLVINEEGMRSLAGGKGTVSPERRKTVHLAIH